MVKRFGKDCTSHGVGLTPLNEDELRLLVDVHTPSQVCDGTTDGKG